MQELLEKRGIATFLDYQDLLAGMPWGPALERALGTVRAVAVFLSPAGLGGWQKREIAFALERQVQEEKSGVAFPVIPVLLQDADPKLCFLLQNTWVDLREDPASPEAIETLVQAVHGRRLEQRAKDFADVCPYLPLQPFQEEDAAFFFGREEVTKDLLRMILDHDLVAVLGASGRGKSSVVHAGLLPALRHQCPPEATWDAISFTPGTEPFHQLATSLLPLLEPEMTVADRSAEARKIAGQLADGQVPLKDYIGHVLAKSRGTDRLLIIIDQFEELFTRAPSAVRQPFVEMLLKAREGGRLSLLFSLRAEFHGHTLDLSRELSDGLQQTVVHIGPMSREELEQAIRKPAQRVGLEFEPGLVTTILNDAMGQPGNLPLLEVALWELCQRTNGRILTHTRYEKVGGVVGAIALKADKIFGSFDPERKRITKHLFTQLVRVAKPEEGTVDTRRRALRPELGPWAEAAIVDEVIHRWAAERLVTITGGGQGEEPLGLELAHEALLRGWPTLAGWVNGEREDLLFHRWFADEAASWESNGRKSGDLLSGPRLERAQNWASAHVEDLTARERAFLQESTLASEIARQRQREEAQALLDEKTARAEEQTLRYEEEKQHSQKLALSRRRLRWAVAVLIVALLLVVGLAFYSSSQKNRAEREQLKTTQKNLLLESEAALGSQPEVSLLRALEALKLAQEHPELSSPKAEETLRQALAQVVGKPLGYGEIQASAVSPDHRWLATAGSDEMVRLWDLSAKDPAKAPVILPGQADRASKIAISSDGRFVAIYSAGEQDQAHEVVRLWDLRKNSGNPFLLRGEDWLGPTPFSPKGHWLVTREFDLLLHDLATGNPIPRRKQLEGSPTVLAFSPGGSWLAAGGLDGTVSLWDLESPPAEPRKIAASKGEIRALAFSPNGRWLISAGADGTVTGWPWSEEKAEGAALVFQGCGGALESLELDASGNWLLGWSGSPAACLWKLTEPAAAPRRLLGPDVQEIKAATFSRDGRRLFTAQKGAVLRWDLETVEAGRPLWEYQGPPITLLSANGRWLLTGGTDRAPRLLDLEKEHPADPDEPRTLRIPEGPFTTLALSSDGGSLAAGRKDGKILLRDLERQAARLITLEGQQEPVTALAFSPDRRFLSSGGKGGGILLWDLAGPDPFLLATQRKHEQSVSALAFSPGNRWLVAGGAGGGRSLFWKLPAPEPTEWGLTNHRDGVTALAFSRDGRWLATAGADGKTRVWPLHPPGNPDPKQPMEEHKGAVTALAFSADGRSVATGGEDRTVRLWDVTGDKPVRTLLLKDHTDVVLALAFSADGRRLASGSRDRTVRLWNLQTPDVAPMVLKGHEQEIRAVAFSPDRHSLITAGADGTTRRWELRIEELKRLACEKAGRSPTCSDLASPP